ncbi:MAG: heavy-metal-associated domain-containing protein, partial [Ruminococcus sp.]
MLKITLKLEGMMCSMCEAHASEAVREAWKIKKVNSSHKNGETVIITENDISDADLKDVMEKTGFKVLSIIREPFEKRRFFQ